MKSDKSFWRYTNLKRQPRSQERQFWPFLDDQFLHKSNAVYVRLCKHIMQFWRNNGIHLRKIGVEISEQTFTAEYIKYILNDLHILFLPGNKITLTRYLKVNCNVFTS